MVGALPEFSAVHYSTCKSKFIFKKSIGTSQIIYRCAAPSVILRTRRRGTLSALWTYILSTEYCPKN